MDDDQRLLDEILGEAVVPGEQDGGADQCVPAGRDEDAELLLGTSIHGQPLSFHTLGARVCRESCVPLWSASTRCRRGRGDWSCLLYTSRCV